uniref:Uncharacterized protein n=1 Tax=Tetradesmus obliquus TaxID=3088 RepID=A0A383W4L4_TETOB
MVGSYRQRARQATGSLEPSFQFRFSCITGTAGAGQLRLRGRSRASWVGRAMWCSRSAAAAETGAAAAAAAAVVGTAAAAAVTLVMAADGLQDAAAGSR